MGVSGLLPQLKCIQNPVSLTRYQGETLAIDGYAWLHRSAHSCAMELALNQPTDKYLQFFVKRISMLRHFQITPFFVFDGDSIQVKKETEHKRSEKRKENRAKAQSFYEAGDRRLAYEYFQKCVSITPEMAKCVIEYLKMNGIPYVVAPYEADAQMVYLEKAGLVHGIISEDSDLLVFGCTRLITKLNDNAECIEIDRRNFSKLNSGKFQLSKLSHEQLRLLVCLSGCDYTSGIPKVGLVTAMKLIMKHQNLEKILTAILREGKHVIPENFRDEYEYADFAFQFQRVWCPVSERLVTLNNIPESLLQNKKLFECIGYAISIDSGLKEIVYDLNKVDHRLHGRISKGELNPRDYKKPLPNREHKLRIQSQSVSSTIDSFYNKGVKNIGVPAKTPVFAKKSHSITNGIMNKMEAAMKRRKLFNPEVEIKQNNENAPVQSKFFSIKTSTYNPQTHEPIRPTNEQNGSPKTKPAMENDLTMNSMSSDIEESDTQIKTDDVETEVPSSLQPFLTQSQTHSQSQRDAIKAESVSVVVLEDESEILSEVEEQEPDTQLTTPESTKPLLASLREKFLHKESSTERVPLRNVTSERVNVIPKTHYKKNSATKGYSNTKHTTDFPNLDSNPISKQRPALRRTMTGALTTVNRTPSTSPSPSISLSQFAYSSSK